MKFVPTRLTPLIITSMLLLLAPSRTMAQQAQIVGSSFCGIYIEDGKSRTPLLQVVLRYQMAQRSDQSRLDVTRLKPFEQICANFIAISPTPASYQMLNPVPLSTAARISRSARSYILIACPNRTRRPVVSMDEVTVSNICGL